MMITTGIFTLIGVAFFVGAKLIGSETSFTDIWTEFAGDGIQSIIGYTVDKLKTSYRLSKIKKCIQKNGNFISNKEKYKDLIQEIKNYESDKASQQQSATGIWKCVDKIKGLFDKLKNKFSKGNKETEFDAKLIIELSNTILFELDYKNFLNQFDTFKQLTESEQEGFVLLIEECISVYRENFISTTDEEYRFFASIIVSSLKDYVNFINEQLEESLYEKIEGLILNIAQSNGSLNLQQIVTSKYSIKYIVKKCPQCGYNGERIIYNEKTAEYTCAACNSTYSFLKNDPDLLEKLYDKATAAFDEIAKDNEEFLIVLETVDSELRNGLEQMVTKTYFEDLIYRQSENVSDKISSVIDKAINDFREKLQLSNENKKEEIISKINNLIIDSKRYTEYLSQQLSSIDRQINSLYEYAKMEFGDLGDKTDSILKYVEKLCTKEYFEDMSNALGAELIKAITNGTQVRYEHVAALNAASVAQIMASIDDIKKECSKSGEGINYELFEQTLQNENAQLSGQIIGLQSLLQSNHAESRAAFRAIIRSQEEIKAILLSKVGSRVGLSGESISQQDFEKMYKGRLPSHLLYNDGLGGIFPCPYCRAEEERKLTEEQYCRCSVCGNPFVAVNPFLPKDENGRNIWEVLDSKFGRGDDDPFIPTHNRVEGWREAHTVKVKDRYIASPTHACNIKGVNIDRNLFIIPKSICESLNKYVFEVNICRQVTILVFSNVELKPFPKSFFEKFTRLEKIVFMSDDWTGRYSNTISEINVGNNVQVYGRNSSGKVIKVNVQ